MELKAAATHTLGEMGTACGTVLTAAEAPGPLPLTSNISKNETKATRKGKKGERDRGEEGGTRGEKERRPGSALGLCRRGRHVGSGAQRRSPTVRQENASHLEVRTLSIRLQSKSVMRGGSHVLPGCPESGPISPALQTSRAALGLCPLPCARRPPPQEHGCPGLGEGP